MRGNKVLSVSKEIYSRKWYIEERRELGKYKEDSSWVWRKNECRN